MADIVIVTNNGEKDFRGRYDSQPFIIPAGGEGFIDREAAAVWFGDWTLRNIGHEDRTQFRTNELNRLKGLYGAHYDDPREDPRIPTPLNAEQKWEANKPQVSIRETDGTQIVSVIEDPTGEKLPLDDAPQGDLARAVASLQDQLIKLESQVAEEASIQAVIDIPEDSPNTAPKRHRGGVKVEPVREEVG